MRVLCLSFNSSRLIMPPFPLGLASVVADWIWDYLKDLTARHPNWIF